MVYYLISPQQHTILPSDTQAAMRVLGLKPIRKNLIMLPMEQKENVNLECHVDDETKEMSISASTRKMRQVHSPASARSARWKVLSDYDPLFIYFHFYIERYDDRVYRVYSGSLQHQ
jgi:hypothetical protein